MQEQCKMEPFPGNRVTHIKIDDRKACRNTITKDPVHVFGSSNSTSDNKTGSSKCDRTLKPKPRLDRKCIGSLTTMILSQC